MKLRKYQLRCVGCITAEWVDQQSTLVVVPTGAGKTQIFSEIVRQALPLRSMVIVHREELVFQAKERIERIAGITCDIEMAHLKANEEFHERCPCVIASVQTLYRRLDKFDPMEFGILIADECFPAGTIVSGRRIETLKIGDTIRTHLGEGCVAHVFRNEARAICEITTASGRRLVCTPDHPIWTQFGFMPARLLTSNCMMATIIGNEKQNMLDLRNHLHADIAQFNADPVLQAGVCASWHCDEPQTGGEEMRHLRGGEDFERQERIVTSTRERLFVFSRMQVRTLTADHCENIQETWGRDHPFSQDERDARPGSSRKGFAVFACGGMEASNPWGQWASPDNSPASNGGGSWLADGGCRADKAQALERKKPAVLLQAGHRQRAADDRSGNRRLLTQLDCSPQTGHQERRVPVLDRVESVAIYKRGSGEGFSRLCPEGVVYNVEVSNGNTYFADGFLVHNCHHGVARSWQTVIAHFCQNKDLKVLGVTATPDRGDKLALGKIFQTVAFDYEILDAIEDGWLVPVDQQMVHIGSLDFSQVRTTAGDLNGGDLAKIMEAEKNLHGMVGSSIEIIGDKSTILFAASVKHAEMACDIFNRHKQGMAEFVSGKTERDQRKEILDRFREGKTQVLANCMVATEGFDAPIASVILNGRPTKSRALYAQIAGRALRPLPGLVDGLETPEERRASIAASAKPSALILDFVGNSGRHKLISCADILGGKHSQDIIDSVTETAREGRRVRITDEMEKEKEKRRLEMESRRLAEEARKARLIAEVEYRTTSVDPFERYNIKRQPPSSWDKMNGRTLSEKQRKVLREIGVDPDTVSVQVGKQLIGAHFNRSCSSAQARVLQRFGYPIEMSAKQASKTIQALADNGWKKPIEVPRDMETV